MVGIITYKKCQTQTFLSCTWGAADPGVQALVDSVRALYVLGGKGAPPPGGVDSGAAINRGTGEGNANPNRPSLPGLREKQEGAGPQADWASTWGFSVAPPRLACPSMPSEGPLL